jgi:hypothetical protein
MPMHDWTRVEAGVYHDFHNLWLVAIRHVLNNGVLPAGYYALTEQKLAAFELDVLALQRPGATPPPASPAGGPTPGPSGGVLERARRVTRRPRRRVTVRHVSGNQPVAVIELVSRGNTADREAVDLIEAGIHLLVIDPFAPPKHAPAGLHASIWAKAARPRRGRPPFAPPADRPLLAASYCASPERVTAAVQPFAVGEPVPDAPLYLTADEGSVTVPLEATYAAAWPEVPAFLRDVLEG